MVREALVRKRDLRGIISRQESWSKSAIGITVNVISVCEDLIAIPYDCGVTADFEKRLWVGEATAQRHRGNLAWLNES